MGWYKFMRVVSINGAERVKVQLKGKDTETGIFKIPRSGPQEINSTGLLGDVFVEASGEARAAQALCCYPLEHYQQWRTLIGEPPPGFFGENLTIEGALETEVRVGDIWRLGTALVQVSGPRSPCRKLNLRVGKDFIRRFVHSRRVGYYLRVLEPGVVAPKSSIVLVTRDDRAPTIDTLFRLTFVDYWDSQGLEELLTSPVLTAGQLEFVREKLERAKAARGWLGRRPLVVRARSAEALGVVSYRLACPYGRRLAPFAGGQFLPLGLPTDGDDTVAVTPFALSGDPTDLTSYRITTRYRDRIPPTSRANVSSYMPADLTVGAQIMAVAPRGDFTADFSSPTVFLSEGLGCASVVSMLYDAKSRSVHVPLIVAHSDINGASHPLREELRSLAASLRAPLRVFYRAPTHDDRLGVDFDSPGWSRLEALGLSTEQIQTSRFYLAGTQSFVEILASELSEHGANPTTVNLQSFGAGEPETQDSPVHEHCRPFT